MLSADSKTGLVLMGYRYYDPGTGRFLTRDPLGYGGRADFYGFADGACEILVLCAIIVLSIHP